ncbi:MAG TPA: hypothetical protein VLL72_02630, partial [Kiloniellales bacterium]|nr:hypothetical protein [Kiloniellales bacterium]
GASIDAARIFTLANGMALDSFIVRDAQGGAFDRSDKLARLSAAIEQTLAGRLRPWQELARRRAAVPSRLKVFQVTPRVLIDNKASASATVIEVNGRDRPGLLYELTQALTRSSVMIHGARIATFGERAVDVFYVNDALGDKIESPQRLRRIQEKLREALADPDAKPAKGEGEAKAKGEAARPAAEKPKAAKAAKAAAKPKSAAKAKAAKGEAKATSKTATKAARKTTATTRSDKRVGTEKRSRTGR